MRFADKERHQLFLEPESENSDEVYVQGISSSMPAEVQRKMYKLIPGFENIKIMRFAYAIEYDCINATELKNNLESKHINGLFFAGQINGTSGYEEAAAQGLMAGINAERYIDKKEPFILKRDQAYIGVLIDDLITKTITEPYRMMTSRAEYRLVIRQDNCDLRLTQLGYDLGLVDKKRYTDQGLKKGDKGIVLGEERNGYWLVYFDGEIFQGEDGVWQTTEIDAAVLEEDVKVILE